MFDENSLVERVLSGDEDAFARLVARLEPRVYQYALRYLGEEQEARQATIETFNQVYRKLHRNMELRLSIWTLRLAADVCADIQKRKRGGKSSMAVFRLREIPHGKHGQKQAATDLDAAIQSQLLRLTQIPEQAKPLSEFFGEVAQHFHEGNDCTALLARLEQLHTAYQEDALPETREAFENRALLYCILTELRTFLQIKQQFYLSLPEQERKQVFERLAQQEEKP